MAYATVIPATKERNGWMVAARMGASILHVRLEAPGANIEAARAEAQRHYPDRLIVCPTLGEPIPTNP